MGGASRSSATTLAWNDLLAHFPDIDSGLHGLRAIIVVHAELIRDTCGYAVPFMAYEQDRDLHVGASPVRTTSP